MKSPLKILFAFILSCSSILLRAQNTDAIFTLADKNNKPVFLVFSGSDWCQQCIRFEKNILSDNTFKTFAGNNFIFYKADFPQRKKLTEEEVKQNELLAEHYNPGGLFPRLLLIRADKTIIKIVDYNGQSAAEFISEINGYL